MMIWKRSDDLYDGITEIHWCYRCGEQAVARIKVERGIAHVVVDEVLGLTEPAIIKNDTLKLFVMGKLLWSDVDLDGLITGEREQRLADVEGILASSVGCLCIPKDIVTRITEAQDELFQAVDMAAMCNETYMALRLVDE